MMELLLIAGGCYLLVGAGLGFYAVRKKAKAWDIDPWEKGCKCGTILMLFVMTFFWPMAADLFLDNSRANTQENVARRERIRELEKQLND